MSSVSRGEVRRAAKTSPFMVGIGESTLDIKDKKNRVAHLWMGMFIIMLVSSCSCNDAVNGPDGIDDSDSKTAVESSESGETSSASEIGETDEISTDDSETETLVDTNTDTEKSTIQAGHWESMSKSQLQCENAPQDIPCKRMTKGIVDAGSQCFDDRYMAYTGEYGEFYLVDYLNDKQMAIPTEKTGKPYALIGEMALDPALSDNNLYFVQEDLSGDLVSQWVVRYDFDIGKRTKILSNANVKFETLDRITNLHFNQEFNIMASHGGCGQITNNLCLFDLTDIDDYKILDSHVGAYDMDGDWLVWQTSSIGHDWDDLILYNLRTRERRQITEETYPLWWPKIHGKYVVYQSMKHSNSYDFEGGWDHAMVVLYNIETQEKTEITTPGWAAITPWVYDNIVVWLDYRNAESPNNRHMPGAEVWAYNIDTKRQTKIIGGENLHLGNPSIVKDKLFTLTADSQKISVYLWDLKEKLEAGW